jgi:hypothetical protein
MRESCVLSYFSAVKNNNNKQTDYGCVRVLYKQKFQKNEPVESALEKQNKELLAQLAELQQRLPPPAAAAPPAPPPSSSWNPLR